MTCGCLDPVCWGHVCVLGRPLIAHDYPVKVLPTITAAEVMARTFQLDQEWRTRNGLSGSPSR